MEEYDNILFTKAASGDVDAFERFIEKYEKLIYNGAYRFLPNQADAQDIAQEVMIKVYKNISKCKNAEAFKGWLFKIIHNTCIDEIRKRKNKRTTSLDAGYESEEGRIETQLLIDTNTPEDELIKKIEAGQIQRAISRLGVEYRSVIILRDINGLSYAEIAEITNLSLGTVKSRISRGRDNLRKDIINMREQNL